MTKKKVKIVALLVFLCGSAFVFMRTGQMQTSQKKTAGEVYKNIQVLKDMPADQLDKVMATFTGSLGVRCNFCHVSGQFEKDDKPQKQTARKMLRMVFAINKENFDGRAEISCNTCHRGQSRPASMMTLGLNVWQRSNPQPTKETPPTVDQMLDKYIAAIGGKAAVEKVTTRILKGSRIGADGLPVPEEVYQKAPDKMLVVTTYPDIAFTTAYDGTNVRGWTAVGRAKIDEDDAEQFKREAQFFQPTKIKEIYKEIAVVGSDKIGDKEVWVLRAVTAKGVSEQLFFDKQTSLLARRLVVVPIIIGSYPFQVDYIDYKDVGGVKIPMTIQWSIPGRVWGRKVTEVKQNVPIEDSKFNPPAK
jgi:hypothetical protein